MSIRATFECDSAADLIAWAKKFLEEEGFDVSRPHNKETPAQCAKRLGVHKSTLSLRLRLPDCPRDFEFHRGATGRFVWLRASHALETFILEGKSLRNQGNGIPEMDGKAARAAGRRRGSAQHQSKQTGD